MQNEANIYMTDVMEKLKMRTYNGSLMHRKPKVLLVCIFEDEVIYYAKLVLMAI